MENKDSLINPSDDKSSGTSRREFLKSSATVLGVGMAQPVVSALGVTPSPEQDKPKTVQGKDPYALAERFNKFLRVKTSLMDWMQ